MIYTLTTTKQVGSSQRYLQFFDSSLNWLDQILWPVNHQVDAETPCFYVFKAFPANLRASEMSQWIELQSHALSPFANGACFKYTSRKGVHFWYSATPMKGVPETALQSALTDGTFKVAGENFHYVQTWKDGVLVSCVNASNASSDDHKATPIGNYDSPWALPRKLDQELKSPFSWTLITLTLFVFVILWTAVGHGITQWQRVSTEKEVQLVSDRLSPILAQQNALRQTSSTTNNVTSWQIEHGFLPESLATVVGILTPYGNWSPQVITWQNKTLGLEFTASDIDIASLVEVIEADSSVSQVTIRPHNAPNTWVLEAVFL